MVNGSDNALINVFLDPTLGCTPFTAPDLSNGGTPSTSQALNELFAAKNQPPIAALVPENDEMTLVDNGDFNAAEDQPLPGQRGPGADQRAEQPADSPANYCQNMVNIQTPFLTATRRCWPPARRRSRRWATTC